jgi:hypothetical protein
LVQQEREHYVNRVVDHCPDPFESLAGWFYKHPLEDIGSECAEEWLSWAFFSKDLKQLNPGERIELARLVAPVLLKCPKLNRTSGNVVLNFMRLHFDSMIVQHKPLVAYAVRNYTLYLLIFNLNHDLL